MALVPPGDGIFGSANDGPTGWGDEKPQPIGELAGYSVGIDCATIARYSQCVKTTAHRGPDAADHPVVCELGRRVCMT